ncbi:hypothetical protein KPL42_02230 [Clostridium gasigenes]|uniref:hypothetical protein n=1 Tax=Clostridium gasigenes TaxID=94869 RepID=UPI001C0C3800|nr:hypothetical protein [Clostridium gasigenes]MBU3087302.1 hypothetical protein [Clostridium gasigenes]
MIKKTIAFQRILFKSLFANLNTKYNFLLILAILIFNTVILNIINLGEISNNISLLFLSLLGLHITLSSKTIMFELLPVSKRFYISNIFLYCILLNIFINLSILLFIGCLVGIFLIMHFVFSIGTMTSSDDNFSLIQAFTQNWKADLFSKLSHLIFIAFGTSFVFIKSKLIKLFSIFLTCGTYVILLLGIDRNLLAKNDTGRVDFFEKFSAYQHSYIILVIIAILTPIIFICSYKICDFFYGQKFKVS